MTHTKSTKRIQSLVKKFDFQNAYAEIVDSGISFSYNCLGEIFTKTDSVILYAFLMYAISINEDAEKHLSICNCLYFTNPYFLGADTLVKWHLNQALKISPNDKSVLQWILAIYNGNPDCPFSQSEMDDFEKRLS